jgi:hypothetical protein
VAKGLTGFNTVWCNAKHNIALARNSCLTKVDKWGTDGSLVNSRGSVSPGFEKSNRVRRCLNKATVTINSLAKYGK